VGALEWIVILEVVIIALLGVLGLIASLFIAKQDPNDPVARFCAAFWHEFLYPPASIPINPNRYIQGESGDAGGIPEATDDDEFYGRVPKSAGHVAEEVPAVEVQALRRLVEHE